MTTRTQIVATAREWIDTPFHHQARLRGVGVDCAGLVIGVARELHLVAAKFDVKGYPRVPDGRSMMGYVRRHLTLSAHSGGAPGDVVVLCLDKDPQHLGILGNYRHGGLSIIHAAAEAGRVIETRLMYSSAMRFVGAFSFPGTEE